MTAFQQDRSVDTEGLPPALAPAAARADLCGAVHSAGKRSARGRQLQGVFAGASRTHRGGIECLPRNCGLSTPFVASIAAPAGIPIRHPHLCAPTTRAFVGLEGEDYAASCLLIVSSDGGFFAQGAKRAGLKPPADTLLHAPAIENANAACGMGRARLLSATMRMMRQGAGQGCCAVPADCQGARLRHFCLRTRQ